MQLTILCDNRVATRAGLMGEHGFSCHIAVAGKQYLFDTGNGLGLVNNAEICGIDLKEVDAVLLSHGHWDHCSGLLPLLQLRKGKPTPIYAHPDIFTQKISRSKGEERFIGTGFTQEEAEAVGARFYFSAAPVELFGGLLFSGEIPREIETDHDQALFYRQAEALITDPLRDDQSLYLQSESGLIVLCGCAHAGVRNILAHAIKLCGGGKIHALIGGLHLSFKSREQRSQIIEDLRRYELQLLAASHCTGQTALSELINCFGPAVTPGDVSCCFQF